MTDNRCECKRIDWRPSNQSRCPCRVIAGHAWSPSLSNRALFIVNDALALLHELRMHGEQCIASQAPAAVGY